MKEEYNDYDDARYDDEYDDQMPDNKAVRGYRIVIIILAVILVALSGPQQDSERSGQPHSVVRRPEDTE